MMRRGSSQDRIPTSEMQTYESVSVEDEDPTERDDAEPLDDDDDNLDDEDNGELGRIRNGHHQRNKTKASSPKVFRRPPAALHRGGSIVLGNVKMIACFMFVTLAAVLIMWQSTKASTKKHPQIHNSGNSGSSSSSNSNTFHWFADDDEEDYNDDYDDDDYRDDGSYHKTSSSRTKSKGQYPVTYDLSWTQSDWNPFNLQSVASDSDNDASTTTQWTPPNLPWTPHTDDPPAFLMQPDVNNRLLVFVSEGDLYVTQYARKTLTTPQPAAKVTTTVGNVRTPRLHPSRPLVAFTATYQGRRDVYLQDLSASRSGAAAAGSTRLTYWDEAHGVVRVVGWQDDHTLLLAAYHNVVALPDIRLFALSLATDAHHAVLDVTPIPLAQAEDAAVQSLTFATTNDADDSPGTTTDCYYFTRMSQPSHTLRYVGGTVQQLWAYCTGYDEAIPLTDTYKGTSKQPTIWTNAAADQDYLVFASDRVRVDHENSVAVQDEWIPGTLNLWAMALPTPARLYDPEGFTAPPLIQVTDLACAEQGRTLQEYRVDVAKRNIVLRLGADLFELSSGELESAINPSQGGVPLTTPSRIAVQVVSDFHETQERLIPLNLVSHLKNTDVLTLPSGQTSVLLTLRGQAWMSPVLHDTANTKPYQGAGQNMPPRRYRVAPGALTGGSMRVLHAVHVPLYGGDDDPEIWGRRLAVVLATDPLSPTAEHAFYLLPVQENAPSAFADLEHAPLPFLGGHVNGGSTAEGGLGSVRAVSVTVSPCGRRLAWGDTDGRIGVMTLPLFHQQYNATVQYALLPDTNELEEPLDGTVADLMWSPGGRYLAITHAARNKFNIISIADCGDPLTGSIEIGRIVQATPSRFNSFSPYWGQSRVDSELEKYAEKMAQASKGEKQQPSTEKSTTLFFLTDRDILNDAGSPWGTRAPMPHFPRRTLLYALPLLAVGTNGVLDPNVPLGRFSGGAPMEVLAEKLQALTMKIKKLLKSKKDDVDRRRLEKTSRKLAHAMLNEGISASSPEVERFLKTASTSDTSTDSDSPVNPFPQDMDIDFGPKDLSFARSAYRMVNVPESHYFEILAQTEDNGSLLLVDVTGGVIASLKAFSASPYPHDNYKAMPMSVPGQLLISWGLSTDRKFIYLAFSPDDTMKVLKNSLSDISTAIAEFASGSLSTHVADLDDMAFSVWPKLEYRQLYNDAWRMLRDFFYDAEMHQVDWKGIHERYSDLVDRCNKREELDDVLGQMAAELSALHVFVYGGEYNTPFGGDAQVIALHQPASLGASLKRTPEWKGYEIMEIPYRDPDFNLVTGMPVYSPLSSQSLWQTGQRGLEVGDVIVGVNGESVYNVPDINMLLRGLARRSVRLEVLRLKSGNFSETDTVVPEPVLVVPLKQEQGANLRYNAWEYRTRELAKSLAKDAGFTVGYVHLRAMSSKDVNAFAQGFFEDYNKQTLILDVRHNHGGNIDSWVTTMLQRAAWSYFGGRTRFGGGDLDWSQQGSFQGHIVVLIDEKTSSDGEGVSRSISELGLGRLIGKRTWGGGIWLASDNILVDGGIATAPEFGVYNEKFGWGLGIEQQGVDPDIEVDNNPRTAFDGKDSQLERAIAELKTWLEEEPVIFPKPPASKPDMSLPAVSCPSTR